ncbi:protein phosphatase 2C domain-containing protein [Nocardioides daejeonensis]|uniref:protein phosphatase 2C domain-containing protein n=1 Tax=Nocardioides daejeonensis TaxID=1046556 RepID=UPI000D750999|nr:protein phosphatase 2C domain-containing protein [Nocardioides daejeonensis]
MTWSALSASHLGSTHLRDGRPNQDAHVAYTDAYGAVAVVADGHGHRAHPRSGTGATLATQVLLGLLAETLPELTDPATAAELLRDRVGPELVRAWRAAVEADAVAEPWPEGQDPVGTEETWLRYGCTVVALAATDTVVAVLQLGDGEAVVVDRAGTSQRPLPEDELLDGVRTTSLCQPDPLGSLRITVLPAVEVRVGYVCTDGFGKPQLDHDGWWRQVGRELAERSVEHGVAWLAERLPGWMEEPATVGGDDTTMAVLVQL